MHGTANPWVKVDSLYLLLFFFFMFLFLFLSFFMRPIDLLCTAYTEGSKLVGAGMATIA